MNIPEQLRIRETVMVRILLFICAYLRLTDTMVKAISGRGTYRTCKFVKFPTESGIIVIRVFPALLQTGCLCIPSMLCQYMYQYIYHCACLAHVCIGSFCEILWCTLCQVEGRCMGICSEFR